jgi:hypothetical protein
VHANSTCLGWDDETYLKLIPACGRRWAFKFADHSARLHHAAVNVDRQRVAADLNSGLPPTHLGAVGELFDLVLCNQVFEHVKYPHAAARTLHSMVAPGGLVFWTAPFVEIEHPAAPRLTIDESDFFRYTCAGARQLFTSKGFSVLSEQRVGDTQLATGWLQGLGDADFGGYGSPKLDKQLVHFKPDCGTSHSSLPNCSRHSRLMERMYISCALVLQKPLSG